METKQEILKLQTHHWNYHGNITYFSTQKDWNQTLMTKINEVFVYVKRQTPTTVDIKIPYNIIVSSNLQPILESLEYYNPELSQIGERYHVIYDTTLKNIISIENHRIEIQNYPLVPQNIEGNVFADDRGLLKFVNGFDFNGVKRFYMVENFSKGYIRSWHGHKIESKYVFVVSGSIKLGVVDLETMELEKTVVLSAHKPSIYYIPSNRANGFKTLEEGTKVIFFSTTTIEESKGDDYRYPYNQWDIWGEDYR